MKIIKRNGSEAVFDIMKIISAVTRANNVVEEADRLTPMQIRRIAESVELSCQSMNRALSVEEIQDLVEHQIMAHGAYEVAKNYITYRYTRTLVRKSNTTDDKILTLIESNNEEVKQENSATIWRARCQKTSRAGCCCRRRSSRRTRPVSSISMTRTILPSTCTTATS
mgnify:CR=1 FL=1